MIERNGGLPSAAGRDVGRAIPAPTTPHFLIVQAAAVPVDSRQIDSYAEPDQRYALLCDVKEAPDSNMSTERSRSEASSFSGAFTRLEMGHMVMGSER